jgi:hypothetical protein
MVLHDIPTGAMAHLEEFSVRRQRAGHEFTQESPPDCMPLLNG